MAKSKGGRPPLKLCKKDVHDLAQVGLTDEEISNILDCSPDTLTRRFSGSLIKGRGDLRQSLKRVQIAKALAGDNTMLIWCGKQYMGQRDSRQEVEHKGDVAILVKHYGDTNAVPYDSATLDVEAQPVKDKKLIE